MRRRFSVTKNNSTTVHYSEPVSSSTGKGLCGPGGCSGRRPTFTNQLTACQHRDKNLGKWNWLYSYSDLMSFLNGIKHIRGVSFCACRWTAAVCEAFTVRTAVAEDDTMPMKQFIPVGRCRYGGIATFYCINNSNLWTDIIRVSLANILPLPTKCTFICHLSFA